MSGSKNRQVTAVRAILAAVTRGTLMSSLTVAAVTASLGAGCGTGLCNVALAQAQTPIQDAIPYYGVIVSDSTAVHCKDSERYYKVGALPAGQVVMIDGESLNWARIAYPASLSAFVRVEDVDVNGNEAKLRADSKLKAVNATSGFNGSWQPLLPTAAKVGTVLTIIEPIADATGPVVAYRIVPPKEARGFVEGRAVRKATDTEVAAFRTKTGAADLSPKPVTPAPLPTPAPGVTDPAKPVAQKPATPAQPIDLTKPVTTPSDSAAAPTTLTQGGSNPGTTKPADASSANPSANPVPADSTPQPTTPEVIVTPRPTVRTASAFEGLESSFQRLAKQPGARVDELDELIGEYEKAIGDETSPRRREGMDARVEFLKLRRDAAETIRRQEEARALLDSNKVQIIQQLAEVQRSRVYTIVGQIQPSTVYDGRNLPLMYRVVSVGSSAPRTLGYMKKNAEFDFDRMLGLVIGVIGETQLDRSMRLNIITPVRVEILKPGEAGEPLKVESAPSPASDPLDGK